MNQIQLLSIQVGLPQLCASAEGAGSGSAQWTTAFLKRPVTGAVWVGKANLEGDGQGSKTHGGTEKAICVYPWEHYPYWQRELKLPEMGYGAFAENLTVRGQMEDQSCIGDIFQVGDVKLQISQPRPPCWRLARWWQREEFVARMEESGRTGWYCRVIKEGYVEAGTTIELLERPCPEWTISLANHLLYMSRDGLDQMIELSSCRLLSESWRESLWARITKLTKTR